MEKLFAVCLGGRAFKSNTEIHDIVFVVGEAIEDTYDQLLDHWCGLPEGLHIDSWIALDVVDGHRVRLERSRVAGKKLFLVNLGAYRDGAFGEAHVNRFLVASTAAEAKQRAKQEAKDFPADQLHTDHVVDIEERLERSAGNGPFVLLHETDAPQTIVVNNGFHPLPEAVVKRHVDHVNR